MISGIANSVGKMPPIRARQPAWVVAFGAASVLVAIALAAAAARGAPGQLRPALDPPQDIANPVQYAPAAEDPPPAPNAASEPIRITGTAGTNLNQALTAAGVSEPVAQDYLRALAGRIKLADGISIADRFDLVVEPGPAGRLLYAGLDRVGASDVQLMRWTVEGKTGWTDADTGGAPEAMRMPVAARVSSTFGMRIHPILGSHRFHKGVDLTAAWGTPIRASADGRVVYAGWNGGYGRQVMIDHGQGLATVYAHMSRMTAQSGERVYRGEVIGFVGSSGLSTGPHLHYEVLKDGRAVNPLTVRYAGRGDALGKEERHQFNARLRQLLTSGRSI